MASIFTTRRHLLSLGLLTCAGVALPAAVFAAVTEPAWLTSLSRQLGKQSTWVSTERSAEGGVELHCGMRDAGAWAKSFSRGAARDTKVQAAGNVLTFTRDGHVVRVVMHPVTV